MHRLLLASLSLVVACSTDATPKNKPVAAPVVEEKKTDRARAAARGAAAADDRRARPSASSSPEASTRAGSAESGDLYLLGAQRPGAAGRQRSLATARCRRKLAVDSSGAP